jgi:hypothetical protein
MIASPTFLEPGWFIFGCRSVVCGRFLETSLPLIATP